MLKRATESIDKPFAVLKLKGTSMPENARPTQEHDKEINLQL